jgi:hypothetical protein
MGKFNKYLRLVAVTSKKNVPVKSVMAFGNAPVPLSLFTDEGKINASTSKAQFMHKLEELLPAPKTTKVNACNAAIYDGHAFIQMMVPGPSMGKITFVDMAQKFVDYIIQSTRAISTTVSQIHVVLTNTYSAASKAQHPRKQEVHMVDLFFIHNQMSPFHKTASSI